MRHLTLLALVPLTAVLAVGRTDAQSIVVPIQGLESDVASVRARAFYTMAGEAAHAQSPLLSSDRRLQTLLLTAQRQPEVAAALIDLLARENERIRAAAAAHHRLPADFDLEGYYVDLMITVAKLHDPRAIHALIPVMANGISLDADVAALGEVAVDPVIAALADREWAIRLGAVRTLGLLASEQPSHPIGSASLSRIRSALLAAADTTADIFVQSIAIGALANFDGPDIRRNMERIVRDTPAARRPQIPSTALNDPRLAAEQWLARHASR